MERRGAVESVRPAVGRADHHPRNGHVLGLPDYYQYASQQGGSTDRTGILTFDIMMQNQGDHNGFSKWMLGWLPDSKITRIFANETGIDVKRDGKVVQHVGRNRRRQLVRRSSFRSVRFERHR